MVWLFLILLFELVWFLRSTWWTSGLFFLIVRKILKIKIQIVLIRREVFHFFLFCVYFLLFGRINLDRKLRFNLILTLSARNKLLFNIFIRNKTALFGNSLRSNTALWILIKLNSNNFNKIFHNSPKSIVNESQMSNQFFSILLSHIFSFWDLHLSIYHLIGVILDWNAMHNNYSDIKNDSEPK